MKATILSAIASFQAADVFAITGVATAFSLMPDHVRGWKSWAVLGGAGLAGVLVWAAIREFVSGAA